MFSMFSSNDKPPPSPSPSTPRAEHRPSLSPVNTDPVVDKKKTRPELTADKRKAKEDIELKIYGRILTDTDGAREVPLCGYFTYGFYDASNQAGTNFLTNTALLSRLRSNDDKKIENFNCEQFIKRYFANYDIFSTAKDEAELTHELGGLQRQLYIDLTYRDLRRAAAERQVARAHMAFASIVTCFAFVNGVIPAQTQKNHPNIELGTEITQGALAVSVLIFAKNKGTEVHEYELARKALQRANNWAREHVEEVIKEKRGLTLPEPPFQQGNSISSATRMPTRYPPLKLNMASMEMALNNAQYIVHPSNNLRYSLFDAITTLRAHAKYPTNIQTLDRMLKQTAKPDEVDLEAGVSNANTPEMIEAISRLFDCPILIIHERMSLDGTYCLVINKEAPRDHEAGQAEEKSSEQSIPDDRQRTREQKTMILYSPEPGYYQPVIPGDLKEGLNLDMMIQNLQSLKPEEDTLESGHSHKL
ncbi:MAG: hypothetical protein K0U24_05975 [Gammaproteobacteria bacterium]|nr:hypothetical protein [Gammaproteobacteria bacterium]MCH9717128.1 hypothetical protein [Gammaproteobacteria bacterium]MCH9763753.1 hypothetical protein [Gammaproteobacteria bacterium]